MIKSCSAFLVTVIAILFCTSHAFSQDATLLVQQARAKIDKVSDYEARGRMKTNVAFLKVPVANVVIYFKKPEQFKIKSEKGVSFVPKGAVSINLGQLLKNDKFTIIDAGSDMIGSIPVRVVKLLPDDDMNDVVLSTLYIDPVTTLILKAKTTTRENGTYELEMTYKKYAEFGLPDRILFSFNTKDYKLPKGVTFDFDDGTETKPAEKGPKNKKGRAEINIASYKINQGIPDAIFEEKKKS